MYSAVVGKKLSAIQLPPETSIVAVVSRDGTLKPLDDDTMLEAHDEVVALTIADQAEALLEILSSEG
jgi:Trk K+ transport system NAD-binding subunit